MIIKTGFFILLLSIQVAIAQPDTFQTVFFKVTRAHEPQTSYLFGTHHAFGKSFFDSLSDVRQSLMSCDILIKENLNIPGQTAEDIINRRTTTTRWNKYLNKTDLAFIETLFASSPTDFHKMTPTEMYVFLNRYFKQQFCLPRDSTDTSLSLDDYIGSIAKQRKLNLIGLETTEEQIDLINKDVEGMPRKVHKKRLAGVINIIRSGNTEHCEQTAWYRNMNMDYQLDAPCQNALILTGRNDRWMKKIASSIGSNSCFIAVGLSHLMYECGLISQLQGKGYTITPVMIK